MQVAYTYGDFVRHDLTCFSKRRTEWSRKGVKLPFFVAWNISGVNPPSLILVGFSVPTSHLSLKFG